MNIAQTAYILKLALFHTIFNLIGVVIMVPFIPRLEGFLLTLFQEKRVKDVHETKYLNPAILEFPGTLISSLSNESKYLYKKSIFEIVAHGLSIHRTDIKSETKINQIIKSSNTVIYTNINELYYSKVKTIYGEILNYIAKGQRNLKLTEHQNKQLTAIRIANRRMVEIIKDTRELSKNVAVYIDADNKYIKKEYDKIRKKVAKVLRVIYLFRKKDDKEFYFNQLKKLRIEAKEAKHSSNKSIDKLIRKSYITPDMASSLVNDSDNVNDLIKKLIQVAELLYSEKDVIFENGNT